MAALVVVLRELMIAPLAKLIDWSFLQLAYAFVELRHAPGPKWKLDEAIAFLNGPDFLPATSEPARIQFDGPREFRFPTPHPSNVEENNTVYGRLYRCAERWEERPVIVLVDGYPPIGHQAALSWLARRVNGAGFSVATLVAPYNLQRRPRRPLEENCLEFARTMAQQVAEIRGLTGWLLKEGCPSVGLVGVSWGGWAAGLTACSDARIAAVVLTMPAVAWRMWRSSPPTVWRRVRQSLQALRPAHEAMDTTRLNLIHSRPAIPKDNILLIKGIHDLFADPEPLEELWQKWGQPEMWRLPHGHISALLMPGLTGRVLNWLKPRLVPAAEPARIALWHS